MTESLVDPVSVKIAPGFKCGVICLATIPIEPTGIDKIIISDSTTVSIILSHTLSAISIFFIIFLCFKLLS